MKLKKDPFGPLLQYALTQTANAKGSVELMNVIATKVNGELVDSSDVLLPVILKLATIKPKRKESWNNYKAKVQEYLEPMRRMVSEIMGNDVKSLVTANSIKAKLTPEQIQFLASKESIEKIELDPLLQIVTMDDAVKDVDLPAFQLKHSGNAGKGVGVAVLDSGIDLQHPFLNVSKSVSTCGESEQIPGSHGTHCAGSIASTDTFFPGIAPGVTLYNIKVLQANGRGSHTNIVDGIDAALDLNAEVLSMSLGFNHLPSWSRDGHGWMCTNGHCPLCTAIDNAVSLDQVVAVVAAGNEHDKAEALRANGYGNSFDTELGCPGQAREAITVAAFTKTTFQPASFSSRGPASYSANKPDIAAPGVNIMSTIPVPRLPNGQAIPNPSRVDLFGRKSGTSMATPIVAGAVALIIEKFKQSGVPITPSSIKNELFTNGIALTGFGPTIGGSGRLVLNKL